MKVMIVICFVFILGGCSSTKQGMRIPQGVVCAADGICEVSDPFDANTPEIKQCLQRPYPYIKRNYEGHTFFIRTEGMMQGVHNLGEKGGVIIPRFFKLLQQNYQKHYQQNIATEIPRMSYYKKEHFKRSEIYLERVVADATVTGMFPLTELHSGGYWVSCYYFNIEQFLRKNMVPYLPQSFEEHLGELVVLTVEQLNDEVKNHEIKFMLNKAILKLKVDFDLPEPEYHTPTQQQKDDVMSRYLTAKRRWPIRKLTPQKEVKKEQKKDPKSLKVMKKKMQKRSNLRSLRFRCRASGKSCFELGLLLKKEEGIPYFRKGCHLKHLQSCVHLAQAYAQGEGIEKDIDHAKILYQKICDMNHGVGCSGVAKILEATQKHLKARAYYEKGCKLGDIPACTQAGSFYMFKKWGEPNIKRSEELLTKGCRGEYRSGCSSLGYLYEQFLKSDAAQVLPYYEKGCSDKNGFGCVRLGILYQEGKGVQKDLVKAKGYFQKGCELGVPDGCQYARRIIY